MTKANGKTALVTGSTDGVGRVVAKRLAEQGWRVHDRDHERGGNALHPATYTNTTMVRLSGVTPISTVEWGADAILKLAVSSEMEGKTCLFFNAQRAARADAQAYDPDARRALKALSMRLCGLPANE